MKLFLAVLFYLPLALCTLHRLELRDFAKDHKLRYDAATPKPREMSMEEIHKELHSLRQRRDSGQPDSVRYKFSDQHSSGIIQYSGTEQKVIFLLTFTPNNNGIPALGTNLYKSTDYGANFTLINTRLEASGKLQLWSDFFVSPENYNQIVFPHATQSKMYVTTNEGSSFNTVALSNNINPRSLKFNPTKGDRFLGTNGQDLWVSEDLGGSYTRVATNIIGYSWCDPVYDSSSSIVYFMNKTDSSSQVGNFYKSNKPYDSPLKFDPNLSAIDGYVIVGSYIFAQKTVDSSGTISLWVSHNRNQFHAAQIPSSIPHQNYFVSSIKDYQALVVVEHTDGVYTLYMSGKDGEFFSESLPDLYVENSQGVHTFDLELVDSMNGTFIANQFLRLDASDSVTSRRTLISFDNGGNWNIIQPPAAYNNGTLVTCEPPACSLHFHMASSDYWRTGVYSQESAPGIIIAHGSIGSQLSDNPDLYLSRDGAITWSQTLLSSWGVSVLDHGGLIVAAADYHQSPSSLVYYTCSEGLSWTKFNFGTPTITVYGVITEPGETTTVVTLYGWEPDASGWVSVRINFTNIFDHTCTASDYYDWEPYDENLDVDCLMGATVVIERRKPDSCCLNGQQYEREISYNLCSCTSEDFECDYGYMHVDGYTGPCIRDTTVTLPATCANGEDYYVQSTGYRKIAGDVCQGGVTPDYSPVNIACCSSAQTVTVTTTLTSYTDTTTSTYPGATATVTITATTTSTATVVVDHSVQTTTITATTTVMSTCNAVPATNSPLASSSSSNSRTIFLGVTVIVAFIAIVALIVIIVVLGFKLHKKRANVYTSVSTRYRADGYPGSPGHSTSPGEAVNFTADDSDEGEKDEDLLIP